MTTQPTITISGAGPTGLAAAITAARAGAAVTVYERHARVGHRHHGDFQGLENWSTEGDVLEELAALGIEPDCELAPFRDVVLFDPDGLEYHCRSAQPLFYVARRGAMPDSLDQALARQARALGVDLRLATPCRELPDGGIVAEGPRRADIIAVGYVFDTASADGAFGALSGRLAAGGYAYLIIHGGRGVVATCLFGDFHHEQDYLTRTVDFFSRSVGLEMRDPRHFGGVGNFAIPRSARDRSLVYAGECAGFQDALAGFGMRYALLSGHLAARALLSGTPARYDDLWRMRFGGMLRVSLVNRFLYAGLGDPVRRLLVRYVASRSNVRAALRRQYVGSRLRTWLYPLASAALQRPLFSTHRQPGCACTWCRCSPGNTWAMCSDKRVGLHKG